MSPGDILPGHSTLGQTVWGKSCTRAECPGGHLEERLGGRGGQPVLLYRAYNDLGESDLLNSN